jgi:hypothetical protein
MQNKKFKRIDRFVKWWTVRKFGLALLLLALVIALFSNFSLRDLSSNLFTELVSIAITVLVIDVMYQHRTAELERKTLILQMGSPNNAIAREAVRLLRLKGWLSGLEKLSLRHANLEDAELYEANLHGADLSFANLKRADLRAANLSRARLVNTDLTSAACKGTSFKGAHIISETPDKTWMLRADLFDANLEGAKFLNGLEGHSTLSEHNHLVSLHRLQLAILPDGKRYDGHFNLPGDLEHARLHHVDPADPQAMAAFYQVPLEVYQQGQEWHRLNAGKDG